MKCVNCGNENANNSKFCVYCGKPLNSAQPQQYSYPQQPVDNSYGQNYSTPQQVPNQSLAADVSQIDEKPKVKTQKQAYIVEIVVAIVVGVVVALGIIAFVNRGGHSKTGEYVNTTVAATQQAELPSSFKVGDVIEYGVYEQDNNTNNGKEQISWYVIAVDDNKALLLSKDILDGKKFEDSFSDTYWSNSYTHQWLSQNFVQNSFSQTQAERIICSSVTTVGVDGSYQGAKTNDYVFLLSRQQYERYIENTQFMHTQPTAYAISQGVNKDMVQWSLRSLGKGSTYICYVDDTSLKESGVVNEVYGIRPAMWVTIE